MSRLRPTSDSLDRNVTQCDPRDTAETAIHRVLEAHCSPRAPAERHMIEVFVSRPSWIAQSFETGLSGFLDFLKVLDLNPRTLRTTDDPSRAPLDEIISLLDLAAGAVILGYPQIEVTAGSLKGQEIRAPLLLSTEWNHIEAGLAYARGLPLLVIHHVGVNRGIFDRGATPASLYERDLAIPHWPLDPDLQGAVKKWKQDCLARKIPRR